MAAVAALDLGAVPPAKFAGAAAGDYGSWKAAQAPSCRQAAAAPSAACCATILLGRKRSPASRWAQAVHRAAAPIPTSICLVEQGLWVVLQAADAIAVAEPLSAESEAVRSLWASVLRLAMDHSTAEPAAVGAAAAAAGPAWASGTLAELAADAR